MGPAPRNQREQLRGRPETTLPSGARGPRIDSRGRPPSGPLLPQASVSLKGRWGLGCSILVTPATWGRAEGEEGRSPCLPGRPVGVVASPPQSSFFSLQKISANFRSCSLAACDSSCSRWLFCLRLATSDCSTALSCFSCGAGAGVSRRRLNGSPAACEPCPAARVQQPSNLRQVTSWAHLTQRRSSSLGPSFPSSKTAGGGGGADRTSLVV